MAPPSPPPQEQRQQTSGRVEPVFVQTSDIALNNEDDPLSCLKICLAAEDVSGPISIIGAQPQGRGNAFWRLYPQSIDARLKLIQAGAITLRGQEASLLQKNPHVVRQAATSTRVVCRKPGHKRGDPACSLDIDSDGEQPDGEQLDGGQLDGEQSDGSCGSDEQSRDTSPGIEEPPTSAPCITVPYTRSRSKNRRHKNSDKHSKQKKGDDSSKDKP
ncbi:PREDICTED: uncharacterized protein LOC109475329 [Branchiostoma belcheri]|uniref:Uncharacterized protein LOC109475329 n=1 Tax=Branchiostoma belcheri TaxID=7741 RepID=A0A6P4ZK90_BRABE|nr:PREDICTED: uncharacterized protein LOC109475329 [Branchiostoma belcheri]